MSRTAKLVLAGVIMAASISYISGCGGVSEPPRELSQVTVCSETPQKLDPLSLTDPDRPRWMDIADQLYSGDFQTSFSYSNGDGTGPSPTSYATVNYQPNAATLSGVLTAVSLKPWFAYQMKLTGKAGILGTDEASNQGDILAWSSYQLGRVGRWWCEDCGWNVSDRELRRHLSRGHTVIGYLLFDWFVTDESGGASYNFALDSSFHVLWKKSQRMRQPDDSELRTYHLIPGTYGYPSPVPETADVTIYAEWEPTRPKPGQVQLAAGNYQVNFNLTEESFHNVPPDLAQEFPWGYTNEPDGGFWAKVLAGDLQFEVTGGEPPSETGSIAGKVTAGTGRGVAGATVTVQGTDYSALTNKGGRYEISEVPVGTYSMTAYKEGVGSDEASDVQVLAGETTTQNFDLK